MKKENVFISSELDRMLSQRVDILVKVSIIKHRKKLISDYIANNLSKFMGVDRLLTSNEVCEMLQISHQTLGRRIKQGKLLPVNSEIKRNYRFKRSDVISLIDSKK